MARATGNAGRWRLTIDGKEWGVTAGALGDVKTAVVQHYRHCAIDLAQVGGTATWLWRRGRWFDGNAADLSEQLEAHLEMAGAR